MKHSGTVLGTGHRPHAHVLPSRRFAAIGPCRSCRCKAVWVGFSTFREDLPPGFKRSIHVPNQFEVQWF